MRKPAIKACCLNSHGCKKFEPNLMKVKFVLYNESRFLTHIFLITLILLNPCKMKLKLRLLALSIFSTLLFTTHRLQSQNTCGTGAPPQQWEEWMGQQVEKYIEAHHKGKSQQVNYFIPVIVHVIHFGELYPNYPNIDSNQIKSQIDVLNQDFNGTGYNVTNVPTYFANLVSNTGIHFCRAAKDQNDVVLLEPGVDRKNAAAPSNNWTSPSTATLDLKSYFQNVIMPATIWDPTKYLNIWISDKPANYPLNGFSTYPAGSGLTGLFGNNFGSNTNDGVWIWAKAFGNQGSVIAPTDKGRTATHEIGHWLGLRHTWGDGNCLSDYANDTPWSKQAHTGCVTSTPANLCGVNQAPNGEMTMNFMDRTDDACMYMFTPDQNVRMQVALSQSPNRYQLGTHNKCNTSNTATPTSSAVANFNLVSQQCLNRPFYPFNTSSGYPYPTYVWSSSPAASFGPTSTQPNPAITITTPGTYTITLVATNSLSSSTHTALVSASFTCAAASLCLDSIKIIKPVDTLYNYAMPNNSIAVGCQSGFAGYVTGNNCFNDKGLAQYFPPVSYTNSISNPQVNSLIVLFDTVGTFNSNGFGQVTCKLYGGSESTGPVSVIGQPIIESLSNILASPKVSSVGYLGKPNLMTLNHKIIPYRFDFATPVIINANSGFYASVEFPPMSGSGVNIFSNKRYNSAPDSSAWVLDFNSNWQTIKQARGFKVQLAIIPQITCSPVVGIDEEKLLSPAFSIVPNPGNGVFSLVFTSPVRQDYQVRIFNSLGQSVTNEQLLDITANVVDLDLTGQPDGIYFIEISSGAQKTVKKIILNH